MYLKSLELQGFKSFANKIVLQFHNGITGVVGPNGSGKSNVSDAIRWVLGEQSAKQLRGGSMQDVIFSGTMQRRPMSYAYVAITLDNADHALPIDYEEVTVARRLYRSGESEYLINGTAVRMRDVQELFFDTGIGKEGYSLIGQGQVEKILNGKPDERRELFDEAAGIVKYKHRKQAAVKKLDSEQANLVRVNDILSELERQVGPLKDQSEKAKIYLSKRDEMKLVDVNLYLIENDRYEENLKNAQDRLQDARKEQEEINQNLTGARTRYEELDEEIRSIDSAMYAANEELSGVRIERQEHAGGIDLAEDRIRSLAEGDAELRLRTDRLKLEIDQRKDQMEASAKRSADLGKEMDSCTRESEAAQDQVRELNEKIAVINAKIDSGKEAIIRILNERTGIQTGRQRASTMIEQLSLRESELNSRELTLRSEERAQNQNQEDLGAQKKDALKEAETLQERSTRLSAELETVHRSFLDGSDSLAKLREEYQRESSRFDTLRAITERYEGYGGAIRRVMEQKTRVPGILGVVADLIQTSKRYELAVETALGGSIQNIVTTDEQTAKKMIAFLKENRFGRATFLPLTAMNNSRGLKETSVLNETGVIGLASEIVTCEDRYKELVKHLLGRTVVVENIDCAVEIARRYHYSLRLVTLDGELLSPGGSMTGGAFKNNSNLLGRRREIDDAKKKLEKMKARLDTLGAQVEADHTKRNRLRDEIAALSGLMQKNEFDLSAIGQKMQDLSGRMQETKTAREQISAERGKIAAQRALLEGEKSRSGDDLMKSDAQEAEEKQGIEQLQAELEKLGEALSGAEERLSKYRVKLAGFSQEKNFIAQNQSRLQEEIQGRERELEEIARRLESSKAEQQEMRQKVDQLREKITRTKEQEETLSAQLVSLNTQKEEKLDQRNTFFEKREELSGELSRLDKEIFRLEEQLKKLEESREKSTEYLWEEYDLTPVQCRQMRMEDPGSVTSLKRQLVELRREIKGLGNVNVGAIEQYKEVSERYEFLTAQHADLVRSAEDLQKVIDQLDENMRVMFREQFERMRIEFDRTFRELFGGGKGTLELVEDEDILEAGIRVIAQPPGKKLQNMLQLSGGEKSLTAIALLFAIQNLKPSPFCLLDEIESALDEANVDRFANYLHKLTKHTQFILITHRRGSMASCDRLYGITMQEKGISALVSVDLVENDLT